MRSLRTGSFARPTTSICWWRPRWRTRSTRRCAESAIVACTRSADAANYARGDERLDLLYARRPISRRLLAAAREPARGFGNLRVVAAERLIGFKLQAVVNDPDRVRDLEDIRALLRANRDTLDMSEVREYFRLFDRESLLDELLRELR